MNDELLALLVMLLFMAFVAAIVAVIVFLTTLRLVFGKRIRITDYFILFRKRQKGRYIYKLHQSLNCKSRNEIRAKRAEIDGLCIRSKLKELDLFFSTKLDILFEKLLELTCEELIIRTHLSRRLFDAKYSKYIESSETVPDAFSEVVDRVMRTAANLKRKRKDLPCEEKGRPLMELKKILGKEAFNAAEACYPKDHRPSYCRRRCKKECRRVAESGCRRSVWKAFSTYRLKLNPKPF